MPPLRDSDVRVDTYRASGPGGQHRNMRDSAVRMVHLPTGVTVTATEERSQHANRKVARERLLRELGRAVSRRGAEEVNRQRLEIPERVFTWTQWRDQVKSSDGRGMSMSVALSGKLGKLLRP